MLTVKQHHTQWKNLDLYTTTEPCPMCQSAIEWAGIDNVFYGSSITFLQSLNWHQINIRATDVARQTNFQNTKVIGGILKGLCNQLFIDAKNLHNNEQKVTDSSVTLV